MEQKYYLYQAAVTDQRLPKPLMTNEDIEESYTMMADAEKLNSHQATESSTRHHTRQDSFLIRKVKDLVTVLHQEAIENDDPVNHVKKVPDYIMKQVISNDAQDQNAPLAKKASDEDKDLVLLFASVQSD